MSLARVPAYSDGRAARSRRRPPPAELFRLVRALARQAARIDYAAAQEREAEKKADDETAEPPHHK